MTDEKGWIMNVTESLAHEMGLHASLFTYGDSNMGSGFNIKTLLPALEDPDAFNSVKNEGGAVILFDSTTLDNGEFEKIEEELAANLRMKMCKRQALVQMIAMPVRHTQEVLCTYRIILLGNNKHTYEVDS
jgi:hypothetical protein